MFRGEPERINTLKTGADRTAPEFEDALYLKYAIKVNKLE